MYRPLICALQQGPPPDIIGGNHNTRRYLFIEFHRYPHAPLLGKWEQLVWQPGRRAVLYKPESPGEGQEKQLAVQFWRGPLSMALSEILATASFPITEEGLAQLSAWLEERAAELAAV